MKHTLALLLTLGLPATAGAADIQLRYIGQQTVPTGTLFEGVEFGVLERSLAVGGQQVSVRGLAAEYRDLFLPLLGEHLAQNLAVAVAALEMFLGGGVRPLDEELLREGLSQVTSPGRLEVLRTAPTLIVDAAHNPDGVRATARAVQEAFGFTRLSLVVGKTIDTTRRTCSRLSRLSLASAIMLAP